MTRTRDHLDALRELHGTDNTDQGLADQIRHLIDEGSRLDEEARRQRKRAGLLLVQLRRKYPRDWKRRAGITPTLAQRLIAMVTSE